MKHSYAPLLLFYWLLVLLATLLLRPLLPVDETRYVAVAWEMWQRGDFLVPYLNGAPYAHKPPLLFWLIHLGWWLFGVNDVWPRLIAPLLSLLSLYLSFLIARRIWPEQPRAAWQTPWILFGSLAWLILFPVVQFDFLLVCCTLLGVFGLLDAMRNRASGWWLFTLAIGLGLLSKGPVILLHLLPLALLAPWWSNTQPRSWKYWYARLLLAVLGGAALVLAWAIPAAIAGGEAYRNAIFWGQTANRVVNSFAHRQPWWWYLPMLPILLLPWSLWPKLWLDLLHMGFRFSDTGSRSAETEGETDQGAETVATDAPPNATGESLTARSPTSDWQKRFLASWILPVILLFSLVSGKQIKYLLPVLPAFALFISWLLLHSRQPAKTRFELATGLLLMGGCLIAALPFVLGRESVGPWVSALSPYWGLILLAAGLGSLAFKPATPLIRISSASVLFIIVAQLAIFPATGINYDLRPISRFIAQLQNQGHDIAYVGKYHAQFHFFGRLTRPIQRLSPLQTRNWIKHHPDGYLVIYDTGQRASDNTVYQQDYRGNPNTLKVLRAQDYLP